MAHCLKENYSVEIKHQSEVKAIFACADAAGVKVYRGSRNANGWDKYPNLVYNWEIARTCATPKDDPYRTWLTVAEFIGCIFGIEPERLKEPNQPVKLRKGDYCIVDSDKYDEIISIAQSIGYPLHSSEREGTFNECDNAFVVSKSSSDLVSLSSEDDWAQNKLSFDEFCARLRVSGTERLKDPEATVAENAPVRFKVTKLICEENGEVVEFVRK